MAFQPLETKLQTAGCRQQAAGCTQQNFTIGSLAQKIGSFDDQAVLSKNLKRVQATKKLSQIR